MTNRSRKSKRKLHAEEPPPLAVTKKLRQKLPRRPRENISPVLLVRISGENPRFSVNSSSGSDFAAGEASCNSSRASVAGEGNANSRNEPSIDSSINRRFEKRNANEVEVSGSSCVDSNSFARERCRSLILKFKRESKDPEENDDVSEALAESEITILKFKSGRETKHLKENDDVSCTKSEITSEERFNSKAGNGNGNGNIKMSFESNGNDVVSFSSGVRASFEEETNRNQENRASECEYCEENCADLIAQSMAKHESDNYDVVADLTCSEDLRFSYSDDELDYCSSQGTEFSEFHSEIFGECSQQEPSDYSLSLFVDSGSQFSQGSVGETPSPTYSLFLQYRKEFSALASPLMHASRVAEDEVSAGVKFTTFEDSDDEDSYRMLRKRERRQGFLSNYGEIYFSTTEFGETVLEQRVQMVHWIVEQCYRKQLRQETMFLGVNLFDRFLSKGYFKAKRNLQIVGIACLTLAIRIEENQQHNRVGQKDFFIGSSVYSRCEVVAMEWMVQEVLKFQCFLPTIYSFLWFYLKAANADAVVEKRVKYLAVLALSGLEQICYWPSTVAAAIVILACLEINQNALKVIGIHVRSKDENLYECIENLEWLLRCLG
ncbi:cyclin-SDS isoform X2 [Cajanus cajan]|uniref:cyclin-SDS isoform X2 n=1 Tax=Cajanus cajan TaxID=3821 RepID=UPI00098DC9A3|nr:cyclin-SDS isoform X2 [Cajanus cajan]